MSFITNKLLAKPQRHRLPEEHHEVVLFDGGPTDILPEDNDDIQAILEIKGAKIRHRLYVTSDDAAVLAGIAVKSGLDSFPVLLKAMVVGLDDARFIEAITELFEWRARMRAKSEGETEGADSTRERVALSVVD